MKNNINLPKKPMCTYRGRPGEKVRLLFFKSDADTWYLITERPYDGYPRDSDSKKGELYYFVYFWYGPKNPYYFNWTEQDDGPNFNDLKAYYKNEI